MYEIDLRRYWWDVDISCTSNSKFIDYIDEHDKMLIVVNFG